MQNKKMKKFDFEYIKSLYLFRYKIIKEKGLVSDDWSKLKVALESYRHDEINLNHFINKLNQTQLDFLDIEGNVIASLIEGVNLENSDSLKPKP